MALTQISTGGIKDDAVTDAKLPANSVGNSEMKDDAVGVAELSATGTASSSTFLRGDNSWVTPTDTNTQLAFANDANNRIVTGDGSGGLNGESKLTYDGSILGQSITSSQEGITLTATGNHYANIKVDANRSGANNGIFNLQGHWDGTEVASIAMTTGDDTTNKDDGYIRFYTATSGSSSTERLRVQSDGDVKIIDGDLIIGTAGHGIDFSATSHGGGMTSELLHSYEEGIYTATVNIDSGSITLKTGYNEMCYTKVGRLITINGRLDVNSVSSPSGELSISLPFTVGNNQDLSNSGACSLFVYNATGGNAGEWLGWSDNNQPKLYLRLGNAATPGSAGTLVQANTEFRITYTYMTAD